MLELIYFPETYCLHFSKEDIQNLIIRAKDISKIIHYSTMILEKAKYISGDYLNSATDTFYDLIQETGDSLLFPGFFAEFSNGIQLVDDFNLTYLKAINTESLFEFST